MENPILYGPDGEEVEIPQNEFPWHAIFIPICIAALFAGGLYYPLRSKTESSKSGSLSSAPITVYVGSTGALTTVNPWDKKPILPAPKDAPPTYIEVGAFTYRVRYTDAASLSLVNALACTDIEKRTIWLNPKRNLRPDLVHELMHAAKASATIDGWLPSGDPSSEENLIHATAPVMYEILRDNPKLVEWLTAANLQQSSGGK